MRNFRTAAVAAATAVSVAFAGTSVAFAAEGENEDNLSSVISSAGDKVEENTRGIRHTAARTYAEEANLGVNQTLMRSINTTVISALPIIALMVVAACVPCPA